MAAGPNDIEAKFILKDEVSAAVKSIDKNVKDATERVKKNANETTKVFDKWNFTLNAIKLGLKTLKFVASKDADIGSIFEESTTTLVRVLESLAFAFTSDVKTMEEFRAKMRETSRTLANENLAAEMAGVVEATERIANIDAGKIHKVLNPFFETGDAYKQTQDAFNGFESQIKSAQERVRFMTVATQDLAHNGLGLGRKEAEALWASMQKVREATDKASDSNNDLKDSHDDAAEAARKQKEAEEALLRTFGGGWDAATKDLEDNFLVAGQAASRFAHEAHSTISNDLFSALKGEAVSFGSFMSHILDGILKQTTDAIAAGLLGSFGGGGSGAGGLLGAIFGGSSASGGAVSSVGSYSIGSTYGNFSNLGGEFGSSLSGSTLPTFADGGTVYRPTLAIVGEGGEAEDIVPHSKRGAYARAHAGGEVHHHHYTINAMDGASVARVLNSPEGRASIEANAVRGLNRRSVRGAFRDA